MTILSRNLNVHSASFEDRFSTTRYQEGQAKRSAKMTPFSYFSAYLYFARHYRVACVIIVLTVINPYSDTAQLQTLA